MDVPETRQWVVASQAGDREAFGLLVRAFEGRAVQLALRLLGCRDAALDVVQDSFVKAFVRIRGLRDPDRFSTWFFRIVNNTALNELRALSRRRDSLGEQDRGGESSEDPAAQEQGRELGESIQWAMGQLSDKEARAMALIGLEGISYQEAASIEGCSQGALRWHVFSARKKLKKLLKDYLEDG